MPIKEPRAKTGAAQTLPPVKPRTVRKYSPTLSPPPAIFAPLLSFRHRCENFATCTADSDGSDISGTSQINADMLALYQEGQVKFLDGDCDGAEIIKDKIVDLMTVPVLQGMLRCVFLSTTTSYKLSIEPRVGVRVSIRVVGVAESCCKPILRPVFCADVSRRGHLHVCFPGITKIAPLLSLPYTILLCTMGPPPLPCPRANRRTTTSM